MSFIDEFCTVFDDEDENKLEFTKIHNVSLPLDINQPIAQDFKKIVENLLEELMKELGVTHEQFVDSCKRAEKNPVHKKIVDQILAVENFMAFKRLMVKRNQELNRQAILLYEKQQKSAKDGGSAEEAKVQVGAPVDPANLTPEEAAKQAAELKEVLKTAQQIERAEEEEMMKRALAESTKVGDENKRLDDEEEEMMRQVMESSMREENDRLKKEGLESQLT